LINNNNTILSHLFHPPPSSPTYLLLPLSLHCRHHHHHTTAAVIALPPPSLHCHCHYHYVPLPLPIWAKQRLLIVEHHMMTTYATSPLPSTPSHHVTSMTTTYAMSPLTITPNHHLTINTNLQPPCHVDDDPQPHHNGCPSPPQGMWAPPAHYVIDRPPQRHLELNE
jgi:hypothetical protein